MQMITFLFSESGFGPEAFAAKPDLEKGRQGLGVAFTQGCGLDGLGPGYWLAAPSEHLGFPARSTRNV